MLIRKRIIVLRISFIFFIRVLHEIMYTMPHLVEHILVYNVLVPECVLNVVIVVHDSRMNVVLLYRILVENARGSVFSRTEPCSIYALSYLCVFLVTFSRVMMRTFSRSVILDNSRASCYAR